MSELPNQPDEPADRPAAEALPPPPLPGQAEAADWTPQDWRPPPSAPATTEVAAGTDPADPVLRLGARAKPPLDTVSLIALISRSQSRTRFGTAGHLGCHPHEESPAPRPHPGRDRALC